jgi:hypothetical protein
LTNTLLVNGMVTLDQGTGGPEYRFQKGSFALQGPDPGTVVTFQRVESKPIQQ